MGPLRNEQQPPPQFNLNNIDTWNDQTLRDYLSQGGKVKKLYEVIRNAASVYNSDSIGIPQNKAKLLSKIKILLLVSENKPDIAKTQTFIGKFFKNKRSNDKYIGMTKDLGTRLEADLRRLPNMEYNNETAMKEFETSFVNLTSDKEIEEHLNKLAKTYPNSNFYCTFVSDNTKSPFPNRKGFGVGRINDGKIEFIQHSYDYEKNILYSHPPYVNVKGMPINFDEKGTRKTLWML